MKLIFLSGSHFIIWLGLGSGVTRIEVSSVFLGLVKFGSYPKFEILLCFYHP